MSTFFYDNHGVPYKTEQEAETKKSQVMAANADSKLWLEMNSIGPGTITKVEVVPQTGGYIVRETITRQDYKV